MERFWTLNPWLAAAIIFTVATLLGVVIKYVAFKVINYYATHNDKVIFDSMSRRLRNSVFLFFPFIILHVSLDQLALSTDELEWARKLLEVGIVISFTVIAVKLINVIQDVLFDMYDISMADNLKARRARTQIIYIKKIAIVVVAILAISMILLSFDALRKFGATILTSAGVAGIIIGFALQKSLANLFAGIQIAFTQPIKIDDAVVVENEWGWIEEINLTYVVVRIWDKRRLILPITYFTENTFQNWTRTTAQIMGSVTLYLDYTTPLDPLRQHFEKLLNESPLWDKDAQAFQVIDTSEKTMTVRMLMTAINSPTAWDLRCMIRERMIDFIQNHYPEGLPKYRTVIDQPDNLKGIKKEAISK